METKNFKSLEYLEQSISEKTEFSREDFMNLYLLVKTGSFVDYKKITAERIIIYKFLLVEDNPTKYPKLWNTLHEMYQRGYFVYFTGGTGTNPPIEF